MRLLNILSNNLVMLWIHIVYVKIHIRFFHLLVVGDGYYFYFKILNWKLVQLDSIHCNSTIMRIKYEFSNIQMILSLNISSCFPHVLTHFVITKIEYQILVFISECVFHPNV